MVDAGTGQQLGEMSFEHCLMAARYQSRRMAGQVGKFDDEAREARARPARPVGPYGELAEQAVDDGLGRARQPVGEGLEGRQREVMLRLEDMGQELVLALEVIVQRTLGDARWRRNSR